MHDTGRVLIERALDKTRGVCLRPLDLLEEPDHLRDAREQPVGDDHHAEVAPGLAVAGLAKLGN